MPKSTKSTASTSKAKVSLRVLKNLKPQAPSNFTIAFVPPLEPLPNSHYSAGVDVVMRIRGLIVLPLSAPASVFTLTLQSTDGSATPAGATGNIFITLQPGSTEQFDFQVVHQVAGAGHYAVQATLVPESDPTKAISLSSDYTVK